VDKVIGERIRKQRAFSGLSQENVAEELGMSTGNYGKLERGEITISVNHLFSIAAVFNIHPGDFFFEPTPKVQEQSAEYAPLRDFIALQEIVTIMKNDLAKVKVSIKKCGGR